MVTETYFFSLEKVLLLLVDVIVALIVSHISVSQKITILNQRVSLLGELCFIGLGTSESPFAMIPCENEKDLLWVLYSK